MSDPFPRISPLRVFRAEPSTPPRPEAPVPQPPSEWRVGSERLREQVRRLRGRADEQLQELLTALERDLYAPLQSAAHEAAAVHAALVKTSHFDKPADALPPDVRWARVRDYRRDTTRRVIAPLRERLAALDLGAALNERWRAFWEDLASLPPRLPVSITRVEPDTLYALSPEDGLLDVLRKRLVQVRRQFQIGPQPTSDGQFYAQEVPLRALAAYHLRVRLPSLLDAHERAIYQDLARAVAAFERAVTMWTHRLLDAERLLDGPNHHLPTPTTDERRDAAATPSPPGSDDAWAAVGTEAKAFGEQLRALSKLRIGERPTRMSEAVHDAWADLEADLEQAGSFLLRRKNRALPPNPPPAPHLGDDAAQWAVWHRQAIDRLAFCDALAALHDATYEHQDALLDALAEAGLDPLLARHAHAAGELRALHDEVDALFAEASPSEPLVARLRALLDRAARLAEAELVAPLQAARLPDRVDETLDEHLNRLARFLGEEEASFELHALAPPAAEVITPEVETRTLRLAALAREHFDAFFAEALRGALRPFRRQIEDVLREDEHVPRILRSSLGAALKEAENASSGDDASPLTAARELALNGLARSADVLDAQAERARSALAPLSAAVVDAFATAWADLHDRARAESRIREHLLELRTLVVRERHEATARAEQHVRAVRTRLGRTLRRGRGRAEELVPKGRSAVGAQAAGETAPLETLDALAHADDVLAGLPLVYRRLFAAHPVTDPSLLAGRDADLALVQRYLDRWRRGFRNALVVAGHHGSGRTSFLNVVQKTMLHDAEVRTLRIDNRLSSEAAFAERVARALDLRLPTDDEGPPTLDRIRQHLAARPRPDVLRVCLVEPLEHLFLRAVNGTCLVERVLTFMSRTAAQVLWVATASEHGWQLLEKTVPSTSHLVLPHRLAPIDRSALEALILARHRRSGLPLAFEPPEAPSPRLRRRLRKARTHEQRQNVLRTAYFDRLHAHCGSNVVLALFYWTRSVRLDDDPLVMRVRPIEPLDFGFLDALSLPQSFLLKALLDHATLTVDEYGALTHTPPDACLALFESLANMLLLQPADAAPADAPFVTIERDRRYRLRPLVVHPIMEHLRGKNILH